MMLKNDRSNIHLTRYRRLKGAIKDAHWASNPVTIMGVDSQDGEHAPDTILSRFAGQAETARK
jgi:hypothetical protein